MTRALPLALLTVALTTVAAGAAERTAYKYMDDRGNVVYSQTPPIDGRVAGKVDLTPAWVGRQAYLLPPFPYGNPRRYSREDDYAARAQERTRLSEEASRRRIAALEAECERNRGTDCANPETLRLIAAQKIPGGRYFRGPVR